MARNGVSPNSHFTELERKYKQLFVMSQHKTKKAITILIYNDRFCHDYIIKMSLVTNSMMA